MLTALVVMFGISYGLALGLWCYEMVCSYKHFAVPVMDQRRVMLIQPLDYVVYEKAVVWEEL